MGGGLDFVERWEGRDPASACLEWRVPAVELHGRIGSTNDRARELLLKGAPAWSVVIAEEQVAGRGRGGRSWRSPVGSGLLMSLVLRPPRRVGPTVLPILAGIAVARVVLATVPGALVGLKWPNDVLIGSEKVCGILAEAVAGAAGGVVLGIGLNVHQAQSDFSGDMDSEPTSLRMAGADGIDRGRLAAQIIVGLRDLLEPWPVGLDPAILQELRRWDVLVGKRLRVTEGPGGPARSQGIEGVGAGIAPDGALLVLEGSGRGARPVTVRAGTVRLLSDLDPHEPEVGRSDEI